MWKLATVGSIAICFAIALASAGAAAPSSTPGDECPPAASDSTSLADQLDASLSRTRMPRVSPSELVACVGASPIDGATLDHWMRIAWLGDRRRHPKLHALDQTALSFLIQAQWIAGEAAALEISLSEAEVQAEFVKLRRQQFPHRREFNAFLRSSGFTVSDLLSRIRVEMLSSRIRRDVVAGRRGKQRRQALARFVKRFQRHWISQTYCAPALRIEICGHPLPAARSGERP